LVVKIVPQGGEVGKMKKTYQKGKKPTKWKRGGDSLGKTTRKVKKERFIRDPKKKCKVLEIGSESARATVQN